MMRFLDLGEAIVPLEGVLFVEKCQTMTGFYFVRQLLYRIDIEYPDGWKEICYDNEAERDEQYRRLVDALAVEEAATSVTWLGSRPDKELQG